MLLSMAAEWEQRKVMTLSLIRDTMSGQTQTILLCFTLKLKPQPRISKGAGITLGTQGKTTQQTLDFNPKQS